MNTNVLMLMIGLFHDDLGAVQIPHLAPVDAELLGHVSLSIPDRLRLERLGLSGAQVDEAEFEHKDLAVDAHLGGLPVGALLWLAGCSFSAPLC